jgi:hypothetical protein
MSAKIRPTDTILLTEQQVEAEYGRRVKTLQGDRSRGRGWPYVKIGGRVFYDRRVIDREIIKATRTSTSQPAPAP